MNAGVNKLIDYALLLIYSKHIIEERTLLSNVIVKIGQVVSLGDNIKGMTQGHGYSIDRNVVSNKASLEDEELTIREVRKENLSVADMESQSKVKSTRSNLKLHQIGVQL